MGVMGGVVLAAKLQLLTSKMLIVSFMLNRTSVNNLIAHVDLIGHSLGSVAYMRLSKAKC